MPALCSPAHTVLQRFITIALGASLLHFVPACGSASDDGGAESDGGAAGSRSGAAGSGTPGTAGSSSGGYANIGGAPSVGMGGAPGAAGSASGGGSQSVGGAPGAGGSQSGGGAPATGGASGSPNTGGKGGMSGVAGAGGKGGTSGVAGAGGGGTGDCKTPPAASPLVGWAAQSGMGVATTTGGGTATPQTVTTLAGLNSAASGTAAKVIYVTGKLAPGKIKIGSNKTIIGLCGAEIHGSVSLSGSANVIIRNLKIVGFGVGNCALDPDYDSSVGCSSGNDAVSVRDDAHHIWFDHCDVSDGTDGNLDITQGADFVTVSWTKFHYTARTDNTGNDSTGASGHRFSNLIGGADNVAGDVGHLNITWHHNWWADNVNQRMPRSRAGKIHLFNNLFTAAGNSYCSNAGQGAALLVENTIYSGVKEPFQVTAGAVGLVSKGNTFPGSTGNTTGSGTAFTPPYTYTPDNTATLQASVQANAGPQ